LSYLWKEKPDLVKSQMKIEHSDFDQTYMRELSKILSFLLKAEKDGDIALPNTNLGMTDLVFELSRRMRKIRDIPEYKIRGKPFAESRNGVMPELPRLPVRLSKSGQPINGVTQEIADRIIDEAYKLHPDLFYDFSEEIRHGFGLGKVFHELKLLFRQLSLPTENLDNFSCSAIGGEVNRRIRRVCGISEM
jgi:hypothetical protein